ncbi:hypothetical protein ATCV1_z851L [Acanthocystis turfacea chlorella virus 1]|uniref:Uncharacterized protein z851L n=1 Tax=Chlorovirus heliozoae TaxID=322019 RepID=A7KAB1_9PHYC|nr:hypothetical protein ATCV1_z851L [Acanthocystis turfacea chlorella virus 1]ABT16985.1 hypothetical protein ATCV1_z851L [Acanthocystis turfacea chlorella virus 1]
MHRRNVNPLGNLEVEADTSCINLHEQEVALGIVVEALHGRNTPLRAHAAIQTDRCKTMALEHRRDVVHLLVEMGEDDGLLHWRVQDVLLHHLQLRGFSLVESIWVIVVRDHVDVPCALPQTQDDLEDLHACLAIPVGTIGSKHRTTIVQGVCVRFLFRLCPELATELLHDEWWHLHHVLLHLPINELLPSDPRWDTNDPEELQEHLKVLFVLDDWGSGEAPLDARLDGGNVLEHVGLRVPDEVRLVNHHTVKHAVQKQGVAHVCERAVRGNHHAVGRERLLGDQPLV